MRALTRLTLLLAALALSPAGPLLLALVGLGLIAHGFYTAARARLARL